MYSEEGEFGCQVKNQSVENGNMALGGETPLSSLYSLMRRSRDSETSLSSNCRRAPSWMSSIASWISWASETTLFLVMFYSAFPSRQSTTGVGRLKVKGRRRAGNNQAISSAG